MKKKVKEMKKLFCTALRDGGAHVTSILLTTVFSCLISCCEHFDFAHARCHHHCDSIFSLKELNEETRVGAEAFSVQKSFSVEFVIPLLFLQQ